MAAPLALVVRVERTQTDFDRIAGSIAQWLDQIEAADPRGQHQTQRRAVQADLTGAICELRKLLEGIDLGVSAAPGQVYETCRLLDQSLVLLRQLWEFYLGKFDQRKDGERLGPLLEAADELIWSCYRRAIERAAIAEPEHKNRPAPLAYVSSDYSPAALESDKPLHGELRFRAAIPELDQFLDNPVIPVLRLPYWCVDDPWWLAFIAHEVGHHVQHDLDLVKHFREGLEQAARDGGVPAAAERWGSWGQEAFADFFSLLMLGPGALRALVEIEWALPAAMNKPRGAYPPTLVRLELMARFAERLGMDVAPALPFGRPADIEPKSAAVTEDFRLIDTAIEFALGPLRGNLGFLLTLCGFDSDAAVKTWFGPNELAAQWTKQLPDAPPPPKKHLDTARQIVSGAIHAWSSVVAKIPDGAARTAALDKLRVNTREALRASGTDSTRASQAHPPSRGAALAKRLLDASRRSLG